MRPDLPKCLVVISFHSFADKVLCLDLRNASAEDCPLVETTLRKETKLLRVSDSFESWFKETKKTLDEMEESRPNVCEQNWGEILERVRPKLREVLEQRIEEVARERIDRKIEKGLEKKPEKELKGLFRKEYYSWRKEVRDKFLEDRFLMFLQNYLGNRKFGEYTLLQKEQLPIVEE